MILLAMFFKDTELTPEKKQRLCEYVERAEGRLQ